MLKESSIKNAYALAQERYGLMGVDTEQALQRLAAVPVSLQCWQGDDVSGFEPQDGLSKGGVMATGNYPGRARTADELRADLEMVYSLLPGKHRLSLHSIYAETDGKKVDRDALQPEHFARWCAWAKEKGLGLDYNGTFFSHPLAESGYTLAHRDESVRQFWIRHGISSRKIGEYFGRELGTPCATNIWIPDGSKDTPADRKAPRERLKESLDQVLAEPINPAHNLDAVESKLFGLASESYVVGSYDFYLPYAAGKGILLCLDMGHFHPTEVVSDKISAVLTAVPEVLLHVSRGVRWDSDHVVILSDELRALAGELVHGDYLSRTHIGLDFFDASINRIAAWTIGARATIKALLYAFLEPIEAIRRCENEGDFAGRLALMEDAKTLPFGAVWDEYCLRQGVPVGASWLSKVRSYEKEVLAKRQ